MNDRPSQLAVEQMVAREVDAVVRDGWKQRLALWDAELGLARTGKLVTSGALILMFAFLVLSTSPGYEVKPLAIGVGAGIILDATFIRALLVPAFMRLMGDWNWWMPNWTHKLLRVPRQEPTAQIAAEAA